MKAHITKRLVDSTKAPATGRTKVYDDTLTGFGFWVLPSGKKNFFIDYGPVRRRRRMVLGQYGALTVDAARTLAMEKLSEIAQGGDPLATKQERARAPTVTEWIDEYMVGVRRRKKNPRHDERYLGMAKERWKTRLLREITRRDVQSEMEHVAERGHTTANRWLASVRACFHAALRSGTLPENPAWGIKPYREGVPRARVLTNDEFKRTVTAIDAIADPYVRAAFLVLMGTGARKSEALRARWEDFDLEGGFWRIPSPKAGRPQVVPLNAYMVDVLRSLDRFGPWLVPGRDPSEPRKDLKRQWEQIRKAVGLEDVTIHDLRRTFGLIVAKSAGLHVASKLLRHSDIRTTERVYTPLDTDYLREGSERAAGELAKALPFSPRHRK